MLSLFQDASGNWHWPSVVTGIGWTLSTLVILASLYIGMKERERAGPWKLTAEQVERFTSYLKSTPPGKVAIEYTAADQVRSHAFADTLGKMIAQGGYDLWGYMPAFQQTGNAPPIKGIVIGTKAAAQTTSQRLQEAFKLVGIAAPIQNQGNDNHEADRAVVYVGIKPAN
jgi:hypothetical protein